MKKIITVLFAFLAAGSIYAQHLGAPTELQKDLNELPAIPIAGKNLKFVFGGTTWVASVNGANVMAGTVEILDVDGGSILTLKQTHIWGAAVVGEAVTGKLGILGKAVSKATNTWVATPGPDIVLDYSTEPRPTLSLASEERIVEARAAHAAE
jgi:hypothetical protein